MRGNAKAAVNAALADAASAPLVRAFSLRHEFPSEWRRFVSTPASPASSMTVDLATTRFPYFSQHRTIEIQRASVIAVPKTATAPELAIGPGTVAPTLGGDGWEGAASPGPWTISTSADPASLSEVLVLVAYSQSS